MLRLQALVQQGPLPPSLSLVLFPCVYCFCCVVYLSFPLCSFSFSFLFSSLLLFPISLFDTSSPFPSFPCPTPLFTHWLVPLQPSSIPSSLSLHFSTLYFVSHPLIPTQLQHPYCYHSLSLSLYPSLCLRGCTRCYPSSNSPFTLSLSFLPLHSTRLHYPHSSHRGHSFLACLSRTHAPTTA
ncbi:MAG: hypothetical protein J3R72DRAFT_450501 [Linnemannia gamsii]|nr:MAG: hypothetical protein J3R72DRAFT_450501 [Linnemannia gamsii]